MKVTLEPVANIQIVKNLFQLYLYDMSEYMGWPPNEDGLYLSEQAVNDLDTYMERDDHFPYLIKADDELAGFCFARSALFEDDRFDMGQFFVLRKFKRQGIGLKAFQQCVATHPGNWLVRVLPENAGPKAFWQKAIATVAQGDIETSVEHYYSTEMLFMRFRSNNAPCDIETA